MIGSDLKLKVNVLIISFLELIFSSSLIVVLQLNLNLADNLIWIFNVQIFIDLFTNGTYKRKLSSKDGTNLDFAFI